MEWCVRQKDNTLMRRTTVGALSIWVIEHVPELVLVDAMALEF